MARVNVQRFGQPQKPNSPGKGACFTCSLALLAVFVIAIIFSLFQFNNYNDFANSKTLNNQTVEFEVQQGESLSSIMKRMVKDGILEDRSVFFLPASDLYLQFAKLSSPNVQSGIHEIPANVPVSEVFSYLVPKACDQITITFNEGTRVEEFGQKIEKSLAGKSDVKFKYDEFVSSARDYKPSDNMDLSFDAPKNLEGYLFPDTYNFCVNSSSKAFLDKLLITFDQKVYQVIKSDLKSKNKSLDEVINLASMVERESFNSDERKVVAGIFYNRLQNDIPLGVDATSQYSRGFSTSENTWWPQKTDLELQLLKDEPYNTRKRLGLPPTPIASPGLDSIKAVLDPTDSDYFYYLHDDDGVIHYAKTLNEHNINTCKYITKTC